MDAMERVTTEFVGSCPFCSYRFEAATGLNGARAPGPGDCTLCIECGEWAFFDPDQPSGTRKPTDAEYQHIGSDPEMARIRHTWKEVMDAKRRAAEKAINVFPTFAEDFRIALSETVQGEPEPHALTFMEIFFHLGALCAAQRCSALKGGYTDYQEAFAAWFKELDTWLAAKMDELSGADVEP